MKVSSSTEICNLALIQIKQRTIASLDDDSVQAKLIKQQYEHAKTYLLAGYEWNFAITNAELNKLEDNMQYDADGNPTKKKDITDPTFSKEVDIAGFLRKFAYPDGFLRLVCLMDDDNYPIYNTPSGIPLYAIEGHAIYTNIHVLRMKYIQDIDDVNLFTPQFIECLSLDLAIRLTKVLTDSTSYRQVLEQDYQQALMRAKIDECAQVSLYSMKPSPLVMQNNMSF